MIVICSKYANIRSMLTFEGKHLVTIIEVDNSKLQIGNKIEIEIEKLKLFFAEGSLKALNIFGQFLMRAFESR